MGALSIVASLWSLDQVITALLTSRILVQFIAQIIALDYIRRAATGRKSSAHSACGYIRFQASSPFSAGCTSSRPPGWIYVGFGLLAVNAVGVVIFKLSSNRGVVPADTPAGLAGSSISN